MQKAYDTILQSEVSAILAAKNSEGEPYRYECARCGEEVRLAAVSSVSVVPHFRHRSGNNDIECENYLGQYGAISTDPHSRKSKSERAEFYFDKNTKMFFLGLCFSGNEISIYEQNAATFELRTSTQERAFLALNINFRNFDPDTPRLIPLERFSYNYFLSNTLNNLKRKYEVFKNRSGNTPTFFKIQGNDNDYKAKLVRSTTLYTNVPYFVVFQSQFSTPTDCIFPSNIKVDDTFRFETMGINFIGKVVTIKAKTTHIDSLVTSWGYQLEASEMLTMLWPPATLQNEFFSICAEYAFLFSSFELQAHGNINAHEEDIATVVKDVSKVLVKSKIAVSWKNAEIVIKKGEKQPSDFESILIMEQYKSNYTVPDSGVYFLFNCNGVTSINNGQSVSLVPGNIIKHYQFGYLDGCIYPLKQSVPTGNQLLNDILIHYKRTEIFFADTFDLTILSEVASQYIEKCKTSGLINSAAKQLIKEGRL